MAYSEGIPTDRVDQLAAGQQVLHARYAEEGSDHGNQDRRRLNRPHAGQERSHQHHRERRRGERSEYGGEQAAERQSQRNAGDSLIG